MEDEIPKELQSCSNLRLGSTCQRKSDEISPKKASLILNLLIINWSISLDIVKYCISRYQILVESHNSIIIS